MLLVFDIGNTSVTCGVFKGKRLVLKWRIPTTVRWNARSLAKALESKLGRRRISEVDGICIASVVPRLNPIFCAASKRLFGLSPFFARAGTVGVRIKNYNRRQIGVDRLVNALAAHKLCRRATIVIDIGTAITIDAVAADGSYLGGAIAPGMRLASFSLCAMTAKLPDVSVARARRGIGRSTSESIRSGIFYGWAGLIDNIVKAITKEMKSNPYVIATGGDAKLMARESRTIKRVVPNLTLDGLRYIWAGRFDEQD